MNLTTTNEHNAIPLQSLQQIPMSQPQTPGAIMALAIAQGAPVETIERMWGLQVAWEKREAEKAFNSAFAAFKAEGVVILKNKGITDGPLKGKKYAELFAVVNAVTPALSRHGLSTSWKLTKDERDWMEVTCILKHADGHTETVAMGAPPDADGSRTARNAIQARASAVSYLERYTLKAILGLSEQEDDNDGRGATTGVSETVAFALRDTWIARVNASKGLPELQRMWGGALEEIYPLNRLDVSDAVKAAVAAKRREFAAVPA